jgi:hypothetical protein
MQAKKQVLYADTDVPICLAHAGSSWKRLNFMMGNACRVYVCAYFYAVASTDVGALL